MSAQSREPYDSPAALASVPHHAAGFSLPRMQRAPAAVDRRTLLKGIAASAAVAWLGRDGLPASAAHAVQTGRDSTPVPEVPAGQLLGYAF
ncbi:MAG: hypothetical protein ACRDJ9_26040, partial [Dehalococcoidia bacterium]